MPTSIALPSCLMDCCKVLFPNLDFSRITFYEGLPLGAGDANGFTMSAGGPGPDINIYLKEYEPCSKKTFLVIAHELVHAVQIQGMTGGGHIPGSWATYYMSHYLGCGGRGADCDNDLEKEAYDFSNGGCSGNGKLRTFIDGLGGALPCECKLPWPTPHIVSGQTYADLLKATPGLVMTESGVGRTWCSLLNFPLTVVATIAGGFSIFGFSNTGGAIGAGIGVVSGGIVGGILGGYFGGPLGAVLGAWLGAYVGGIVGGATGWLIDELFSGPSARIWFTAYDGNNNNWIIPDVPVSQQGHTNTSHGPALAAFTATNKLYMAYKSSSSTDLWYNEFDAAGWLVQDRKITQAGHTKTSEAPALAEFGGKLHMVYKSGSSNELWHNWFDGTDWQPQDTKISQGGHSKTSKGPALAALGGRLYTVYKADGSNDIWCNYYDGNTNKWLDEDFKISKGGHTQTNEGPALANFGGKLYLVYKSASNTDLWYNVSDDGEHWPDQDKKITRAGHTKTSAAPALADYGGRLYMAYKAGSSSELWYNYFDGNDWQDQDTKISASGHVLTGRGPALAVFGSYLLMVYRDDS
jgi:hypothetical protein